MKQEEAMSHHSDMDNHSNQMNPNNDAYWESRGYDERPDDWEEQAHADEGISGSGEKGHEKK